MRNFTGEHLHVIENVGCRCKICKGSIFKSKKRQDADVVHYGVLMLVAYMLSGPVIGLLFVNMNCMQSTGNALPATILSILRQGLLLIPLLYLLNALFGLNGVIYGQALTDYIAVIFSIAIWVVEKKKFAI